MRISDWSSDVCSSDLPAHFLLADLHVVGLADLRQQKSQTHAAHGDGAIVLALRLQLGLGGLYIVFMARLMEKLLPDLRELRLNHRGRHIEIMGGGKLVEQLALHMRAQIGRASCRERVCQYV